MNQVLAWHLTHPPVFLFAIPYPRFSVFTNTASEVVE